MQHETKEATPAALAARFFEVLLERFDTLSDLAEQYGVRSLADLAYFQHAILTGGFVDAWPASSVVVAANLLKP